VPTSEGEVPDELAKNPRVKYPFDFNEHIIETTEKLESRLNDMHRDYAPPL